MSTHVIGGTIPPHRLAAGAQGFLSPMLAMLRSARHHSGVIRLPACETMPKHQRSRNTRTRILVGSLLLFNEQGEPSTSTNEIADEVGISPGNLHYHFRRKSDLIEALLLEFRADARRALEPPGDDVDIEDFWAFLHLLLETTTAYRFLLRDMDTLVEHYPKVSQTLQKFARALAAVVQLYIETMRATGMLTMTADDVPIIGRSIVVVALFSDRFDAILERTATVDQSAMRAAVSIFMILTPHAAGDAAIAVASLTDRYR